MIERKGHRFVVVSYRIDPGSARVAWDYDWLGSVASALRHQAHRLAQGIYSEVYIQRMRLTKSRKRGSRRFLYASDPMRRLTCSGQPVAAILDSAADLDERRVA